MSSRFGASPDSVYGDTFYEGPGFRKTKQSADLISNYLFERYKPSTVLDIGCGTGNYLACFASKGCMTFGVEGSRSGVDRIPHDVLGVQYDLRKPLWTNRLFELVLSVEVAEHIPKRYSGRFVSTLCSNASGVVVFTAAPPGTPGDDHINCRERRFWDGLFVANGFDYDEIETTELRRFADANDVAQWWKEWSFVYRRSQAGEADT